MVVVSEFVGCSPSVSGAIRVNPWSIDAVADGIYKAIKMQRAERHLRHEKHWRYISQHTVRYWTEVRPALLRRLRSQSAAVAARHAVLCMASIGRQTICQRLGPSESHNKLAAFLSLRRVSGGLVLER